jgi:DNA-directed RNA polymerase specialized sigma24 family protein
LSRRHVQLTYYAPPPGEPAPEPGPRRDALHGYSLADLDRIALHVVRINLAWWPAGDRRDQRDTAWEGIAEHLCAASSPPSRQDLIEAGRAALSREVKDHARHHGAGSHNGIANAGARFAAFWSSASAVPSPEGPVTERVAVAQVLAALTPRQQDALLALALHGDYWAAAEALGIRPQTFRSLLGRARGEFFRLWFAPDVPPRVKGTDRRTERHETGDPAELERRARDAERARARRAGARGEAA